jgi:ATP-dependent RNA helicase DHX29
MYETPEILRLPLEELCLRIKACHLPGSLAEILNGCLDAPPSGLILTAIASLQQLQALDADEALTPLGMHLAHLPVDVHLGKMILYGSLFRCLDPILTIAAALAFKSPLVRPFGSEHEAYIAHRRFFNQGMSHQIKKERKKARH